jgi:hypothetical protein
MAACPVGVQLPADEFRMNRELTGAGCGKSAGYGTGCLPALERIYCLAALANDILLRENRDAA